MGLGLGLVLGLLGLGVSLGLWIPLGLRLLVVRLRRLLGMSLGLVLRPGVSLRLRLRGVRLGARLGRLLRGARLRVAVTGLLRIAVAGLRGAGLRVAVAGRGRVLRVAVAGWRLLGLGLRRLLVLRGLRRLLVLRGLVLRGLRLVRGLLGRRSRLPTEAGAQERGRLRRGLRRGLPPLRRQRRRRGRDGPQVLRGGVLTRDGLRGRRPPGLARGLTPRLALLAVSALRHRDSYV
ncbi:hypothetical protein [Streptomyces fradiae]|uniref:hypothetical protein n=1 Tax=Streptomyces fradiae TaxID=1906 RepID=UPI0036FDA675